MPDRLTAKEEKQLCATFHTLFAMQQVNFYFNLVCYLLFIVSCLLFIIYLFTFVTHFFHLDFQALEEEIENHATDVHQAVKIGQSLSALTCPAEQGSMSEKLDSLQARYSEIQDRCCRKATLLEQALFNARLFGEDEVEVLNWLAEVEDKLSTVFVKDYRQDVLQKQHADHLVFVFSFLYLCY